MRGVVVALVAIGLLMEGIGRASAFSYLEGERADHTCITHDDNPHITEALARWATVSGITDCGVSARPDIQVRPAFAEFASQGQVGGTFFERPPRSEYRYCVVMVRPDYTDNEWVWTHEVGHCLGLNHSEDRAAQMFSGVLFAPAFAEDDIAGIQSLYGPRVEPLKWRYSAGVGRD